MIVLRDAFYREEFIDLADEELFLESVGLDGKDIFNELFSESDSRDFHEAK